MKLTDVQHLLKRGAKVQGYRYDLPPAPATGPNAHGAEDGNGTTLATPRRADRPTASSDRQAPGARHFVLPYPPSVNRMYRAVNGRSILSAEGRAYKARVSSLAFECKPFSGTVAVELAFYRPARRGDLDNLLKATLDALKGVAFVDDAQVQRIAAVRREDKALPRVEVTVREISGIDTPPSGREQT